MYQEQKIESTNICRDDTEEVATTAQLPKFVQGLLNGTIENQVECCRYFRKLSSIEKDPPLDVLIESGIVPRLIKYLKMEPNDDKNIFILQLEAAWILTNISASSDSEEDNCTCIDLQETLNFYTIHNHHVHLYNCDIREIKCRVIKQPSNFCLVQLAVLEFICNN